MTTKDKLIEKQRETIDYLVSRIEDGFDYRVDTEVFNKYQSEISDIESEIAKENDDGIIDLTDKDFYRVCENCGERFWTKYSGDTICIKCYNILRSSGATVHLHNIGSTTDFTLIAQPKYKDEPMVTDGDIEKSAMDLFHTGMALEDESPLSSSWKKVMLHETQGFRAGAKWMRSKMQGL